MGLLHVCGFGGIPRRDWKSFKILTPKYTVDVLFRRLPTRKRKLTTKSYMIKRQNFGSDI
jgi:hypothetical protein